eukprot:scaffold8459_cov267-Pinguiococcus_pyrenoidosus.AAC.7
MAAGSPLVSADSTTTATGTPGLPIAPEPASATALQGSASEASESSCAVGCLGQDKSCNDFGRCSAFCRPLTSHNHGSSQQSFPRQSRSLA